jgi:hypothetical protein
VQQQATKRSTTEIKDARLVKTGFVHLTQSKPATGSQNHNATLLRSAGTGAVVAAVTVTVAPPLPDPSCGGLKLHVVNAGVPVQEKVTLAGNALVFGETVSE